MRRGVKLPLPSSGTVFERLTVVGPRSKLGKAQAVGCLCACGKFEPAMLSDLYRGVKKSCGCLALDAGKRLSSHARTHGMSKTPEYKAWFSMINRCRRSETTGYERYGGRGIAVCDEWRGSFLSFYEHVGPRPSRDYSLDRIDVNGDYSPGNVRWATRKQQQRNIRSNLVVMIHGIVKALSEWSETSGIPAYTIKNRLDLGWEPMRAVFEPSKLMGKRRK